jgi:hypothetical protein
LVKFREAPPGLNTIFTRSWPGTFIVPKLWVLAKFLQLFMLLFEAKVRENAFYFSARVNVEDEQLGMKIISVTRESHLSSLMSKMQLRNYRITIVSYKIAVI